MKVISTPVASVSGEMEMSSAFVSLQGFAEEPKLEVNFLYARHICTDSLSQNEIIASYVYMTYPCKSGLYYITI